MQRKTSRRKAGPVVSERLHWLKVNQYYFESSYRSRRRAMLAYRLKFGGPHPGPCDLGVTEELNKFLDTITYPSDMLDYEGMAEDIS